MQSYRCIPRHVCSNDNRQRKEIWQFNVSGYTFDDVIALPGSIDFGVEDVALDTRITRNIPMVSEWIAMLQWRA